MGDVVFVEYLLCNKVTGLYIIHIWAMGYVVSLYKVLDVLQRGWFVYNIKLGYGRCCICRVFVV